MAMSRYRLVCRMGVVLANLVVPRGFAIKMCGPFVMYRCRYVVVCGGHDHPSCASYAA
jgi:hypothetical protein